MPRILLLALLCLIAAGCGTTHTSSIDREDLYAPLNRASSTINDQVSVIEKPIAAAYHDNVPVSVRKRVHNFVSNTSGPVTAVNNLLQGESLESSKTLGRFIINSTLGLGGIFDLATDWGLPEKKQDCGDTLEKWGVGAGDRIVLPLTGTTNERDAAGSIACGFINPLTYIPGIGITGTVRAGAGLADGLEKKPVELATKPPAVEHEEIAKTAP